MKKLFKALIILFYTLFSPVAVAEGPQELAYHKTPYDGGIIVPERRRLKIMIFRGGTSPAERNWNNSSNLLWSMSLKNAKGVSRRDMKTYNSLWRGDNSINDVKRVIHKGKVHLIVTGNGGNAVAMYEFATKRCIYWSRTSSSSPHDVAYLPVGNGYLVVAHARGSKSYLELYDITTNNRGRIRGSEVPHNGVHSVHWDGEKEVLWAWGSNNATALKSYEVVGSSPPRLRRINETYPVTVPNFKVGVGHGGAPMLVSDDRNLILAGFDGILRFDTDTHQWSVIKRSSENRIYRNPKGLSYNPDTGEIILAKSTTNIYSTEAGPRTLRNSKIYKVRWWCHNYFSFPDVPMSSCSTR